MDESEIYAFLIDDSRLTNILNSKMLSHSKMFGKVIMYTNGDEALSDLRTQKHSVPDIYFIDIHMPGFNGFQLIDQISNLHVAQSKPSLYVVLSANILSLDTGFTNELIFPVEKPLTLDKIKKVVNQYQEMSGENEKDEDMLNQNDHLEYTDESLNTLYFLEMQVCLDELLMLKPKLDGKQILDLAHKMKGVSVNYGKIEIVNIVEEISNQIHNNSYTNYTAKLNMLSKTIKEMVDEV
jgi:response regulator RpfG family c-di-GMP phosphodiesterase